MQNSQIQNLARSDAPIRAGVYETVAGAEQAISRLLKAGFTKDEITVMCASAVKESKFREYEHQELSAKYAGDASIAGGLIGATLGALTILSGVIATGGMAIVAAGAAAGMGGMAGTFVGAMMTRGLDKELADFYEQALLGGNILVSVEEHGLDARPKLAAAAEIFAETGTKPFALAEG